MNKAPIFLTGFSGAGKTTIGKALAFSLSRKFYDLDAEIELLGGGKISSLMESLGEEGFRNLESQILNSLVLTQESVVALGGGALISHSNLAKVKSRGCLIYLENSLDHLMRNLKKDSNVRPLLKDATPDQVEHLMSIRKPGYLAAHMTVHLRELNIQESSTAVEDSYKKWLQNQLS